MDQDADVLDPKPDKKQPKPVSLDDLLDQASKEVAAFDAKKARKSELEAFVAKSKVATTAYDDALYATRRSVWKSQNERIERLHKALSSQYAGWKTDELLDCICSNRKVVRDKRRALQALLDRTLSAEERARDKAEAARDDAKKHMDALVGNDKKVEAWLKENDKKITDINREMEGIAPAGAIYSLWIDLLPRHRQLMAAADAHCLEYANGETPDELCKVPADPPVFPGALAPQHAVPWIVAPAGYPGALQLAWEHFDAARQIHYNAEAALAAFQMSIVDTGKELDAKEKSLVEDIKVCLNSKAPPKLCADASAQASTATKIEIRLESELE